MASFYLTIVMACFVGVFVWDVAMASRSFASFSNSTRTPHPSEGIRQDASPVPCDINELKNAFPSMDYAFAGYDIVGGYPLSKGRDPGFRAPIFKADYKRGKPNGDCRYMLPKGIIAVPDVSCDVSFKSDVVQSTAQFHDSLSVSANIEGGGSGFEFSASASYQKSNSDIASKNYVYVISKAKCTSYFSRLEVATHPPFDEGFLAKAKKLAQTSGTGKRVTNFIETYGTHFLDEVTFGSSYTHEHRMSSSAYETLSKSSFDVSVQASYSGLFSVGGGFSLDSEQQQAASTFSKKVETSTVTVGSAPPSDGDAMSWAASSRENPVPVAYRLRPIADLFTDRFFDSGSGFDYQSVSKKLENAAQKSCEIHKSNGVAVSCANQKNYGATQVVTISGGYPILKDAEVLENNYFVSESQPSCELMCTYDTACVGYTNAYSEKHSYFCQVVRLEKVKEEEKEQFWWITDQKRIFTLYFNRMVYDLTLTHIVPKVVDSNNKKLFAYYKSFYGSFEKDLDECRDICVHDPECKAFRFGKCHNGDCIERNCYIFHKFSSLSGEELTETEFHFISK